MPVRLIEANLNKDEIPPGTLYLLILKTLALQGELHGYEIANSIHRTSEDVLQVEEGSLYPALQRMLIKGWVTAEWARPLETVALAITR
jgi:PadR family transcriptional regulator, regulatory protein PadR